MRREECSRVLESEEYEVMMREFDDAADWMLDSLRARVCEIPTPPVRGDQNR